MLDQMKYLNIALPQEMERTKQYGDFARAARIADRMIADPKTPLCMKERLKLEKEILSRLPSNYPYTEEEGLALIRQEIPDFTMEELHEWEDNGAADFIYINGTVHLQDRFFSSMKKVYPEIAARAKEAGNPKAGEYLDANILEMKKNGHAGWHIHMKCSIRIKDEFFHPGKVLVHLPVPAACINMQNIHIIAADPEEYILAPEDYSSRTIAWEMNLTENRTFSVEYEYDSVVRYTELKPEEAQPCTITECLEEQEPQQVITPLVRHLVQELSGDETNPVVLARRFYDFCTTNCTYSFMPEYVALGNIPDYFISRKKGDCGVQALTFIAMCRCAGIPAHWQSGLYINPASVGHHDWAMFYIEPYGWCFADCSFGGSAYRAGNKERHDYYFGNLDPFRMAANNELQMELIPAKKQYRHDPYDNQSGEIEYEDRGVRSNEFDAEQNLIEIYPLHD